MIWQRSFCAALWIYNGFLHGCNKVATIFPESSLSFFFPVLNINWSFERLVRRFENLMFLSFHAIYFPDAETCMAKSAIVVAYLFMNSVHEDSSFIISYCSFTFPFYSIPVMRTLPLETSIPIFIHTTSSVAGDILSRSKLDSLLFTLVPRYYVETKGSQSKTRPRRSRE